MVQYFLKLVTLASLVVAGLWLWNQRDYEPALAVLAGLAASSTLFVNDERQKRKTARQLEREEKACRDAHSRIERERENFVVMAADTQWHYVDAGSGEKYDYGPAYIYPWDLLKTAIDKLKATGRFPILTRRILRAIDKKQPGRVVKLIDKLAPKLRNEF